MKGDVGTADIENMSEDQAPASTPAAAPKKRSPVMLAALLFVGLAAGVGISKATGGSSTPPGGEPPPEPGEIAVIEPINVNLAGGHFLRIGVGAQLTKKVPDKGEAWVKVKGSKVADAIITVFSGRELAVVQSTQGRLEGVHELEKQVTESTEGEVMKIYLSEYVSQ